jgi:hypothetical protein
MAPAGVWSEEAMTGDVRPWGSQTWIATRR